MKGLVLTIVVNKHVFILDLGITDLLFYKPDSVFGIIAKDI